MSFSLVSGNRKNLWIGKFSIIPEDMFVHGISTRHGGVSKGAFDSLNLGLHVEDDLEAVRQNRDIFFEGLELPKGQGTTCQQVHGSKVVKITKAQAGSGMYNFEESISDADALITDEPGIPLMLFFADCTPILIADPVKKAIGVAHGGWRGTAASIGAKTVELMVKEYGSRPEDLLGAVGPAIGPCCYEVGEEVSRQFKDAFPEFYDKIVIDENGRTRLNLWKANELQLVKAGLRPENIDVAGVCTACNHRQFFSYRADKGKTGRIAAVLSIK
ncbi:peptidoglycan editing factor PgeF [Anaerovibrio sp. RM50]|uniref:peptidoglycan editing factor PgeF n=1 Tax=Anaerovibrio sp. RM50 TaxID=1200557 RepID=UPI000482EDC1|nr:peptidoglycan editing factor PgeF [Anaerovibrio sp. RM50]